MKVKILFLLSVSKLKLRFLTSLLFYYFTMIGFLLLCFAMPKSYDKLYTHIEIYAGFTAEEVRKVREERQAEYDKSMDECKKQGGYMKDFCEMMYEAMKPENMISDSEVEETIRKTDSFSILISSFGYYGKIDLSTLKSRAALVSILQTSRLSYLPTSSMYKQKIKNIQKAIKNIKIDASLDSMLQVHNAISNQIKDNKAYGDENQILQIVGDVKNKVGYLQITSGITQIIDSPLNADCAAFLLGKITKDSQPINAKYLTVDLTAFSSLNLDNVHPQQFFLTFFASNYDSYDYKRIDYGEDSWRVYYGNSESSLYLLSSFKLPYSTTQKFGILTNSLIFLISRSTSNDFEIKALNITVGQAIPTTTVSLKDQETIYLKLDKIWKESSQKPKVVVVADKKQYSLDQSEAPGLEAEIQEHYVESPPKKKSNKIGIIIGVVVAVVVVVVIVIVVIIIVKKKKAAKAGSSNQEDDGENNVDAENAADDNDTKAEA